MKKIIKTILCVFAIVLTVAFPALISKSVKDGIALCLYTLVPALLPFMLIVNIMQKHDLCSQISYILKPILKIFFKISDNGCFAVIIGFICGYPMGAKTISDLYIHKKISFSEAAYLVTFCNNCSLSFLLNYIFLNYLQNSFIKNTAFINPALLCVILVYCPAFIVGTANRFLLKPDITVNNSKAMPFTGNPILLSVKSLTTLSVYVICFNIMSRLLLTLPINATFKSILCGVSEITSGTAIIFENISGNTVFCTYLILLFTVFGGISITMQSLSQICHSKLKVYYLVGKLKSSVVFTLLFFILYLVKN